MISLLKPVYDSVIQIPLDMSDFGLRGHSTGLATYFREILRMEMKDWCSTHFKSDGTPYDLYKDGIKDIHHRSIHACSDMLKKQ